jgi:hypothetical protein
MFYELWHQILVLNELAWRCYLTAVLRIREPLQLTPDLEFGIEKIQIRDSDFVPGVRALADQGSSKNPTSGSSVTDLAHWNVEAK